MKQKHNTSLTYIHFLEKRPAFDKLDVALEKHLVLMTRNSRD